jgi:transposase
LFGVGPISAAQLLVSWSHAGRFRSEAAFAALAGASPIPACSGRVVRHRLNRGGDRQLNQALHTIAPVRLRDDPGNAGLRYPAHRRGQELAGYQALLERILARQLFRLLERYDQPGVEVLQVA